MPFLLANARPGYVHDPNVARLIKWQVGKRKKADCGAHTVSRTIDRILTTLRAKNRSNVRNTLSVLFVFHSLLASTYALKPRERAHKGRLPDAKLLGDDEKYPDHVRASGWLG